jgi:hypothetical protein
MVNFCTKNQLILTRKEGLGMKNVDVFYDLQLYVLCGQLPDFTTMLYILWPDVILSPFRYLGITKNLATLTDLGGTRALGGTHDPGGMAG